MSLQETQLGKVCSQGESTAVVDKKCRDPEKKVSDFWTSGVYGSLQCSLQVFGQLLWPCTPAQGG